MYIITYNEESVNEPGISIQFGKAAFIGLHISAKYCRFWDQLFNIFLSDATLVTG